MQNLTTAAIVLCPELPVTGLDQSMHNPTIELSLHDILNGSAISGDDIGVEITRSLISDAVKRIHNDSVSKVFARTDLYSEMPTIHRITTTKTEYWQLGGISENEGTIAGTYAVHDNIFLKQLGLD
jgi:hypothetical protein